MERLRSGSIAIATPLLLDRERRDDRHCAKKSGADWDRYRARVKWIVPFVY